MKILSDLRAVGASLVAGAIVVILSSIFDMIMITIFLIIVVTLYMIAVVLNQYNHQGKISFINIFKKRHPSEIAEEAFNTYTNLSEVAEQIAFYEGMAATTLADQKHKDEKLKKLRKIEKRLKKKL